MLKLFNLGLILMATAVLILPVGVLLTAGNLRLLQYVFLACGILEITGLIFVLVYLVKLKRKKYD